MPVIDSLGSDDRLEPPNEELLNVIRTSDKRGVGTSEIVEAVDLGSDAVRKRLRGLEAEGRVESETIGSEEDYNFVWYIADEERTRPVNPKIDRLVHWCEWIKDVVEATLEAAKYIGFTGLALVVLSLTAAAEGLSLHSVDPSALIFVGWAVVVAAVVAMAVGGGLISAAVIVEKLGEGIVERRE